MLSLTIHRDTHIAVFLNGEVVGKIVLAHSNKAGIQDVALGFELPPEIQLIRSDAIDKMKKTKQLDDALTADIIRCIMCNAEYKQSIIEDDGVNNCPNCETEFLPVSVSDDVSIKINWKELHILCVWAKSWAVKTGGKNKNGNYPFEAGSVINALVRIFSIKAPLLFFLCNGLPLAVHENL